MLAHGTVSDEVDLALCRSALYEALALGFRPPTEETAARLASAEGAAALGDAAGVLDAARSTGLADPVPRPPPPPAGTRPPDETEYGEDSVFLPAQEMSDLAGFFRAFGLRLDPAGHERIDHISCECEFLLFLARKEAFAGESADGAMGDECRRAAR